MELGKLADALLQNLVVGDGVAAVNAGGQMAGELHCGRLRYTSTLKIADRGSPQIVEPSTLDTSTGTSLLPRFAHVLDRAPVAVEDVGDDLPGLPLQFAGTPSLIFEDMLKGG